MKPKISYAKAGVNLKKIKTIQSNINKLLKCTANSFTPNFLEGHYAGLFKVGKTNFAFHCDGVGTKILVAQKLKKHDTIGIDAIAMNVNDIVCIGARPIVAVDYIALTNSDEKLVLEILKGLIKGCKLSNIALIGGETAILPDMLKKENSQTGYDLAAAVVGVCQNNIIDGSKIKENDLLIGLESSGLHSNGFSLARKILDIKKWGKQMLQPTKIYSPLVLKIIENFQINGIAHITGGAFSKLIRLTKKSNFGFVLDNMPKPAPIFQELFNHIGDLRECYRTFNMGIGMVIVAPNSQADDIIKFSKTNKINAKIIGHISKNKGVFLVDGKKQINLL
jgi:phosphoribosylformylglycinamidine cyclo-ligase